MSSILNVFLSLFVLASSYCIPFIGNMDFHIFNIKNNSNAWVNVLSKPVETSLNSPSTPVLLSLGRKIKLNDAQIKDLEYLPGIGPKTAEKIVLERQRVGSFKKIEELMQIKGIKEKKLAKIKEYIEL